MGGQSGGEGTFSAAERTAMRERAAELKAAGIAALPVQDREIAELVHKLVAAEAPALDPKTWYGFPSYARDGKVVVFYQPASKFDTRYGTVGFSEDAHLDAGSLWPTAYAVLDVTAEVEATLQTLIRRAAG